MGRPLIDITGQRFGRLIVIDHQYRDEKWRCRCDCGKFAYATGTDLRRGCTRSCGCLRAEAVASGLSRTHGMHGTPEYETWRGMRERCLNPNHGSYARYGGRGITVCASWENSFEAFLADMGPRLTGCTLDRINNDGPYSPENCRWATTIQQARNKSHHRLIEVDGQVMTASAFAETLGVGMWTVGRWLNKGLTAEQMRRRARAA